jgi:hypothetical protein
MQQRVEPVASTFRSTLYLLPHCASILQALSSQQRALADGVGVQPKRRPELIDRTECRAGKGHVGPQLHVPARPVLFVESLDLLKYAPAKKRRRLHEDTRTVGKPREIPPITETRRAKFARRLR